MAAEEILQNLGVLFDPGDCIEIRFEKGYNKWFSGYYDYEHFDKLAKDIENSSLSS